MEREEGIGQRAEGGVGDDYLLFSVRRGRKGEENKRETSKSGRVPKSLWEVEAVGEEGKALTVESQRQPRQRLR